MTKAESIRLDQFLKLIGAVNSGGEAKHLIQDGAVRVNGEVETRRGRKLANDDIVNLEEREFKVNLESCNSRLPGHGGSLH